MSMVKAHILGEKLVKERLQKIAQNLKSAKSVRIGFLEGSRYSAAEDESRADRLLSRSYTASKDGHPQWEEPLRIWGNWGKNHPRALPVAQVAFWAEFGTSSQSPRPFMRGTVAAHKREWGPALAKFLKDSEYDAELSLRKLGGRVADEIVEAIQNWPADNKPLTAYIKGFNASLRDRGIMARHVDFEVA